MCTYFVLNKYYYIIILYGGSHASDILHVLMGVSVAKLIIYNIVLLFICHNKRSSSSSWYEYYDKSFRLMLQAFFFFFFFFSASYAAIILLEIGKTRKATLIRTYFFVIYRPNVQKCATSRVKS